MPIIYLSPSTQEFNYYVTGGTEEQYMNLLADRMEPYLDASGIRYVRNTPDMTAASSIIASNAGNYDLHLALHSNASPEGREGTQRGPIVFYYPTSEKGQRAATIIANNLKEIYPEPSLVRTESTTSIGEVRLVRAPSAFLELAYHDNGEDATWIVRNLDEIAQNLVLSLTDYFDIPFFTSLNKQPGKVDIDWGVLNIRARPDLTAPILKQLPDNTPVTLMNRDGDWYLLCHAGTIGYAHANYITVTSE